jgi:hypothetical protein
VGFVQGQYLSPHSRDVTEPWDRVPFGLAR